ncbi:MAG: addiction module protein [Planctomycetota bacterium]
MTARSKTIFDEAMRLPADERSQVALALLDSSCDEDDTLVDPGAEAAWDAEIDKRIAEIDSGKVVGIPHDEVMASIRAKYKWSR